MVIFITLLFLVSLGFVGLAIYQAVQKQNAAIAASAPARAYQPVYAGPTVGVAPASGAVAAVVDTRTTGTASAPTVASNTPAS